VSSGLQLYVTLLLYAIPGLVVGFVLHELAHAYAAMSFGDPTPRAQGRLTLDPRQHIDPIGMGALLVIGFGWAKPVQFSPFHIRSHGQQAVVAAAGPLTNLVLAVLFAIALHLELINSPTVPVDALQNTTFGHGGGAVVLYWFLIQAFYMNVVLFVFNMLPIPGIDGFMVFRGLLGGALPGLFHWMETNRQMVWFGAIVILFLLPQVSGGTSNPLASIITRINDFLYRTFVTREFLPVGGLVSLFAAFQS